MIITQSSLPGRHNGLIRFLAESQSHVTFVVLYLFVSISVCSHRR